MHSVYKGTVVSTFNSRLLVNFLENTTGTLPVVSAEEAPFGQVHAYLLAREKKAAEDFVIIWTQPESVIESFQRLLNGEGAGIDAILDEVDGFAGLVRSAGGRFAHILIPSWVVPTYNRCLGTADLKNGIGIQNCVWRMNLRLCDRFQDDAHIIVLNTQRWIEEAGVGAFDAKLWYMGKIPFAPPVFMHAASDCKTALRAAYGFRKKLLIVDLDDTMWGGIVGDDGWEHLRLGGHDPIGEAYRDFQKGLKVMQKRGILLGIVSKNDERTALTAINSHPEMVLREDDFAGWKINWNDKAENVRLLASELKLGLESVVFIDDNPVERARVAEALPEVEVPEWPADPMLYASALLHLSSFDTLALTTEDASRTALYKTERLREDARAVSVNAEQWLESLQMKVCVEELNDGNIQRTVQLLNKTNQMNMSTRRMTGQELRQWMHGGTRKLWVFSVSDRFGESGLTGITSMEICEGRAAIIDFILSCRVMGRSIEKFMVAEAVVCARQEGCALLSARYLPTEKNSPCRRFWKEQSGFDETGGDGLFQFDPQREYARPSFIQRENVS